MEELAGIIITDAETGKVTMMPKEAVRRPGGFVQGAIMTLIGEVSAQTFAEAHYGTPCVVTLSGCEISDRWKIRAVSYAG